MTYGDGMFVSADFGDTWASASQGLPPTFVPKGLAFDPLNAALLYVQGDFGVYRSRDGGRSWTSVLAGSGALDRVQHLAVTASSAVYVRRLLLRTARRRAQAMLAKPGRNWRIRPRATPTSSSRTSRRRRGALLATSTLGVARSIDDGTTWQTANSGMFGTVVEPDAGPPGPAEDLRRRLLSPRQQRNPRSWNRGATWQVLEVSTAAGRPYLHDLLIDPDNPDHLLVAVSGAPGFALSASRPARTPARRGALSRVLFDCLAIRN